jgi:hypothetical protein
VSNQQAWAYDLDTAAGAFGPSLHAPIHLLSAAHDTARHDRGWCWLHAPISPVRPHVRLLLSSPLLNQAGTQLTSARSPFPFLSYPILVQLCPRTRIGNPASHVVLRRPARGVVDRGGVHAVAAAVPGDPGAADGDAAAGRLVVLHVRRLHRGGVAAAELGAAGRAHRARPPHPLDLLRRLLRGLPGLLPEGEPLEGPLRAGPRRGQLALGRRLARPPPPRARQLPLHHPRHVGAVNGRMWVLLLFDSTRARMRLYCWLLLDRSMDR